MNYKELQLKNNAEYAISRLTKYRKDYKNGMIRLDVVKIVAKGHIEVYDKYAKLMAKKRGVPFKKFSLAAFLR